MAASKPEDAKPNGPPSDGSTSERINEQLRETAATARLKAGVRTAMNRLSTSTGGNFATKGPNIGISAALVHAADVAVGSSNGHQDGKDVKTTTSG